MSQMNRTNQRTLGARAGKREPRVRTPKEVMNLLGVTSAVDPKTLPRNVCNGIAWLTKAFLFQLDQGDDREEDGMDGSLSYADADALALAVRVLLRPEAQALVLEEARKDD